MTDQYGQNNINQPRTARTIVATTQAGTANADDNLIVVDSTNAGGAFVLTLHAAAEAPAQVITIVGRTANLETVNLAFTGTDTLVGTATLPLAGANDVLTIQSTGVTGVGAWVSLADNP